MSPAKPGTSTLRHIRALALDFDGVLTDGGLFWGPNGEEWKRLSFADIMAVSLARRAGIQLALISGEDSPLIDRYAEKMSIVHVFRPYRDKAAALRQFASSSHIPLAATCFMGDDINDLAALRIAGLAAAPASADPAVLAQAAFVTHNPGGRGAVRELVNALLAAQNLDPEEVFSRP
jgi:3-deoxy-D-manno-octulosonate 8-phosphate phosphatase (KDO 8-P phosphatase)